jgi:hypothetical protein
MEAPMLWKMDYSASKPIFVTVDTSLTKIKWVINQEDEEVIGKEDMPK